MEQAEQGPSPPKISKNNAGVRSDLDPNSSDHVIAMTQLKEKIASLQKQISIKDVQLLNKEKMVSSDFFLNRKYIQYHECKFL